MKIEVNVSDLINFDTFDNKCSITNKTKEGEV